jgi:hypothetical protein
METLYRIQYNYIARLLKGDFSLNLFLLVQCHSCRIFAGTSRSNLVRQHWHREVLLVLFYTEARFFHNLKKTAVFSV